jgi:hypothetical protein
MYEKEIQFITDYNLNKINNLGSSFTLEKLTELELHPAIIRYISAELDYLIYEDRKVLLENSSFDYSGVKINEYFNQIAEELKKTKKLSLEQVKKFIGKAVSFNANFTIQPLETLIDLVFKNEESKNVSEIKVYLNHIYYYDYLRDVLNSYFVKKKLVSINKKDFESTIKKINDELHSQKSEMIISDAIDSIADFYNEGGVSKSSVHINFVGAYLKSENLEENGLRLNKAYKNSKKKTDVNEIKEALFSLPADSKKNSKERKEKKSQEIEFEDKALEVEKYDTNIEEKNISDEIEEMNIDSETFNEVETEELIEEVPINESKFEKDIFSFLSKKETEKIISIIFNDDGEDFTITMEVLEECNDYNSASEVLKEVFSNYKIDPYNKEAVALTDAVSDYFHQAD